MIDVYEFFNDTLDRINKEENGYLKTQQFNRLLQYSSVQLESDYVTELQYADKSDRRQYLYDMLMPFEMRTVVPATDMGVVLRPGDYEYWGALRVKFDNADTCSKVIELNNLLNDDTDPTIDKYEIQGEMDAIIQQDRFTDVVIYPHEKLAMRLTSRIPGKQPSVAKPVGEYGPGGWKVHPSQTASCLVVYYRKPATALLVMKYNELTGDIDYDPDASVDIEWSEKAKEDLLKRIVTAFAIYVRETELYQMAQQPATK